MRVELRNITKRFGPVVANKSVNLTIEPGKVLGLLGENGAGKSTLMNVLCGLYRPTEGEILIDGQSVTFYGPGDAIRAGIGMVHQHFMLVPVFSVAENVVLGVEPVGRADHLDLGTARSEVRRLSQEYRLVVDPDAVIETLPVGVQQRVEIIKVLYREADILIFDEPTAVLTPQEVDEFFQIVRSLCDAGKSIVFITHKLNEILEISDRIAVIRRGEIVGGGDPRKLTRSDLAEMMVGHPVKFEVARAAFAPGEVILDVEGLTVLRSDGAVAVDDLSMQIRSGEVVGIAGVQGNGQSALIETLAGLMRPVAGHVRFDGAEITNASPRERHRMGIAHIPEDRQRAGLIANFSVAENMILDSYYGPPYSRGTSIDWPMVHSVTSEIAQQFDVRATSVRAAAGHLSGGNQQKLIVARELSRDTRFVIAGQPTRGLDVGSIAYIHSRLMAARDEGDGLLIVSSELDEIIAVSDRILVMFKGRIVAEYEPHEAPIDKSSIGLAMAGVAA